MTASRTLLRIIAAGGPKSIEQLAAESGITEAKVRYIVEYQRAYGCLEVTPRTFSLTPKGMERANHVTRAQRRSEMAPKAQKPPKATPAPLPAIKTEDMVSYAVRNQPPLAACWGPQ